MTPIPSFPTVNTRFIIPQLLLIAKSYEPSRDGSKPMELAAIQINKSINSHLINTTLNPELPKPNTIKKGFHIPSSSANG